MNFSTILDDLNTLIDLESASKKNKIKDIENILLSNMFPSNDLILPAESKDAYFYNEAKEAILKYDLKFDNIKIPLKDRKLKVFFDTDYYPAEIRKDFLYTSDNVEIHIRSYKLDEDTRDNAYISGELVIKHKLHQSSIYMEDFKTDKAFSTHFNNKEDCAIWNKVIEVAVELSSNKNNINIEQEARDLLLLKYDVDINLRKKDKEIFNCFYNFYTTINSSKIQNKLNKRNTLS